MDAMQSVVAQALRPLIERITTSDYVTPWQVGELVRRCCVNQYYTTLPIQLEATSVEALRQYIEELVTSYYPDQDLLNRYHSQYRSLLAFNSADFNPDQRTALRRYFQAHGRTIQELQQLLNMRVAQITAPAGQRPGAKAQGEKMTVVDKLPNGSSEQPICALL